MKATKNRSKLSNKLASGATARLGPKRRRKGQNFHHDGGRAPSVVKLRQFIDPTSMEYLLSKGFTFESATSLHSYLHRSKPEGMKGEGAIEGKIAMKAKRRNENKYNFASGTESCCCKTKCRSRFCPCYRSKRACNDACHGNVKNIDMRSCLNV